MYKKKFYKAFRGYRRRGTKFRNLTQVISLESPSVRAEDYKSIDEKTGTGTERSDPPGLCSPLLISSNSWTKLSTVVFHCG